MNIAIFSKTVQEEHIKSIQQIVSRLEYHQVALFFYEPIHKILTDKLELSQEPGLFSNYNDMKGRIDCLLSVGGDGTLLDTISLVRDSGIPILGINLGRMGFLASIAKDRIIPAIDLLVAGKYCLDKRTLIRVNTSEPIFGEMNYAMNEVSWYRKVPQSVLKIQTYVNGEFVNSYWADGLIVSTPTGSTAYSLSNGGPIILPGSQNFVITPIATHNLTVRPIVIPDDSKIRINVVGRIKEFFVNLDSRSVLSNTSVEFTLEKEDFKINLVMLEGESYFRTIREKLLWGLDVRN